MFENFFSKSALPDRLPHEMETLSKMLEKSKSKEECLKKAYDILSSRFRGYRTKTYTRLWEAFVIDIPTLWEKDYVHCHGINLLLRALLVKSGWFSDDDITLRWTLVWYISPHQYLEISLGKKKVSVDIWAKVYGIRFGDYARGFNT